MKVLWDNSLSINISIIDDQHKQLIAMINSLDEDISLVNASKVINELVDYTSYHFSDEESYMLKFNYSGFKEHKKMHDSFIKRLEEYIRDFEKERLSPQDLYEYLINWLTNHIKSIDRKYAQVFIDNGMA